VPVKGNCVDNGSSLLAKTFIVIAS